MQASEPFISIVIPTYNRAGFLAERIPGLLRLDYDHYEIIVVDDGSTDNTQEVMSSIVDERLQYFRKENGERAAARNFGALKAKGDYITFLDSDDLLFSNALKNAAAAIEEKSHPFFLHLAYEIGTLQKANRKVRGLKDSDASLFIRGNPLSCMGVFIRREIFQRHRFNEDRDLSASEDWEFWIRLAANFNLRTDNRMSGRLIEHDSRSVISVPEEKLRKRKELAIKYAFEDKAVRNMFKRYKDSITAYWDTYIALHLAIDGNKTRAMHYLLQGMKNDVRCLFTKRALVICKLILLK